MGCFNITCFASNQTIAPGDLCRVLPVIQEATYRAMELSLDEEKTSAFGVASSTCYADSFWRPAGGFITAKYDDYGRVELVLDPLMRAHVLHLTGELLQHGYVTAQGENEYHDLPFDLRAFLTEKAPGVFTVLTTKKAGDLEDKLGAIDWQNGDIDGELVATWDYIWEVVFKQRVFISHRGNPRAFTFAVIHEEAYQALVVAAAGHRGWDDESLEPTAVLQRTLTRARGLLSERAIDPKFAYMEGFRMADTFRDAIGRAGGQSGTLPGIAANSITSWCLALVEKRITDDELIERMLPLMRDQQVYGGFNSLNLRISPMVTASQDYDNSVGTAYVDFVTKVSGAVTRGRITHMYGPFQHYAMRVPSVADMDKLKEDVREWDAAIEGVEVTPVDGVFAVTFSCTLELGDLREALTDEGHTLMAETLVSVADSEPDASLAESSEPE